MSVTVIFSAFNTATSIAGYLGIIESVGGNVKKLLHQSFKSAVQNLQYATTASGSEQMEYLRRAREKFIDAVAVEENENLISSLLGLSMCQHLLNDKVNARKTFELINDVKLSTPEKVKSGVKGLAMDAIVPMWVKLLIGSPTIETYSEYQNRVDAFNEYKQSALSTQ